MNGPSPTQISVYSLMSLANKYPCILVFRLGSNVIWLTHFRPRKQGKSRSNVFVTMGIHKADLSRWQALADNITDLWRYSSHTPTVTIHALSGRAVTNTSAVLSKCLIKGTEFLKTSFVQEVQVQRCFTSTGIIRAVRGRGAQDDHLDFHTAPEQEVEAIKIKT